MFCFDYSQYITFGTIKLILFECGELLMKANTVWEMKTKVCMTPLKSTMTGC